MTAPLLVPPPSALADATDTPLPQSPQSPRAIANAVVAEAMAERARLTQNTNDENTLPSSSRGTKRSVDMSYADPEKRLKALMESDNEDKHEAVTKLLYDSIENLMQEGLKAFHKHESAARDLVLAKEELGSKDREIQRLRANEESSRTTITVS